jgi:hypothetical protein
MMMFLLGLFCGSAVGWLGIALLSANHEAPPTVTPTCHCAGGNKMTYENGGHMTARDMNEGSMCG